MKIIIGRAGTGKTYTCMDSIKKEVKNDFQKALLYIVPEQFSFEAERELINVIGKDGIINTQVLSFKRLAYRIFEEQSLENNYIKTPGKTMLIYSIMTRLDNKLKILKNSAKNHGLIDTVVDIISEFKRYNVTPEMIRDIDTNNEYLKNKMDDLYIIYSEFENKIKDKLVDENDELSLLADLISKSNMLRGSKIWIDEFDGFTLQEYKIIEELDKIADVTVTLNIDSERPDLFVLNSKTKSRLNKIATKGTEEEFLGLQKRYKNKELECLESNIFKYPFDIYEGKTKHISILSTDTAYMEVENVACQIIKYVREKNLRYENIAILTRNLDTYKNIFKSTFNLYKIPYFLDDKRELASQPLITLVLALLEICSNNYSYESMFNYLKTNLTNIEDINDVDLIENYVLKWGIKGTMWTKNWEFEDNNLEKINVIRENIISPILEFKNSLINQKTAKDIIISIYNFLISIGVYKSIQNKIEKLKSYNTTLSIEVANEYTQVWNIFMQIIDEMTEALGNEKMSFEKFKNILKVGISKHQISLIPTSKDQVIIGDVQRTRNNNIKVLFIVGVNDGAFPMTFSSEGFINDDERNLLNEKGIELAKDTKMLLFEENFNIYKALSVASEDLCISYPTSTLDGASIRPSFIINQIKKIFPNIRQECRIITDDSDVKYITSVDGTFPHLLKNIRDYVDDKEIDEMWKETYGWYRENENEKIENIMKGLDYKNTIENANKKSIRKLYGDSLNASVSKLEKFSSCPFSFYLRYGLLAKERKVYKLESPDIGSFMHEVIDRFSKYMLENNIIWRGIEKEWCDNTIDSIVEDVLKDFKHNLMSSTGKLRRLTQKLKRVVKRMVWLIITHIKMSSFDVYGSEVQFGKDKEYPGIEIELSDSNKIVLNGKIDRIDVAQTDDERYIRIIDYKSSDKQINLSDVYNGIQLQLLTYLDAVASDELKPGGVLYLKLDDPIITAQKDMPEEYINEEIAKKLRMKGLILSDPRVIKAMDNEMITESRTLQLSQKKDGTYTKMPVATKEQIEDLRNHIRSILKNIGEEIMNGNVKNEPIKNKKKTPCSYCEYRAICQFDKQLGNRFKVIDELKEEEVWEKCKRTST